jgi:hypothetical protein
MEDVSDANHVRPELAPAGHSLQDSVLWLQQANRMLSHALRDVRVEVPAEALAGGDGAAARAGSRKSQESSRRWKRAA